MIESVGMLLMSVIELLAEKSVIGYVIYPINTILLWEYRAYVYMSILFEI